MYRMIIASLLLLLIGIPSFAASIPTLTLGPATVNGSTVTLPITFANVQGTAISGLVVDIVFNRDADTLALPMNGADVVSATAGPATLAAGKDLSQTSPQDGVLRLTLISLGNTTPIGDGVIATVTFNKIAATALTNNSFAINPQATTPGGVITTSKGVVNVTPSSSQGDVNSDGAVNVFDALLTLQYAVGLIPHTAENTTKYTSVADVSPLSAGKPHGDGAVDVFDALSILRHAVGLDVW